MSDREITCINDFVRYIEEECEEDLVLFRGQPVDEPLRPKIARLTIRDSFEASEKDKLA